MFLGKYNGSVLLTYLGVLLAITGIFYAFQGELDQAMIFLILAGLCDLFDGTAARHFKRDEAEMQFGVEIDSLADSISFLALPLAAGLSISGKQAMPAAVYALYILAGIIRLAYFNLTGVEETVRGRKNYHGLPVTYAALILPIAYLPLSFLPNTALRILWPILYLFMAGAFIIDLKIPKPDRAMNLKLLGIAAVFLILYGLAVIYR